MEQVVCAAARVFIATPLSTFSGYIHRLRGYTGAPDRNRYYHPDPDLRPRPYRPWRTTPFWGVENSEMWDAVRRRPARR